MLMSWFFGEQLSVDPWSIMKNLMLIIVIPTLIGLGIHHWSKGLIKEKVHFVTAPTSKLAFALVIVINAAVIAPYVKNLQGDIVSLLTLTIGLVAVCYVLGYAGSKWLKQREMRITLTYAVGMRNISLGVVLAVAYFEPMTAVPVILTILLQQPTAALVHHLLKLNKTSSHADVPRVQN